MENQQQLGPAEVAGIADEEIDKLRQKLALLQQIQAIDARINAPAGAKPAMRVKVPEGRYSMSPAE